MRSAARFPVGALALLCTLHAVADGYARRRRCDWSPCGLPSIMLMKHWRLRPPTTVGTWWKPVRLSLNLVETVRHPLSVDQPPASRRVNVLISCGFGRPPHSPFLFEHHFRVTTHFLKRSSHGSPRHWPCVEEDFWLRERPLVARYLRLAKQVSELESSVRPLTDAEIKAKTGEFRSRLADGASISDLTPEIFAVAREAMDRAVSGRFSIRAWLRSIHTA